MANTIIVVPQPTPQTIAAGNFPLSTLNSGTWAGTWTPAAASTASEFGAFECVLATNDNGGLWFNGRQFQIYDAAGGTLKGASNTLAFPAGAALRFVVKTVAGTNASSITVTGAAITSGAGQGPAFTTSAAYFTNTALGVGFYIGGGFTLSGTVSSIDDNASGASGSSVVASPSSAGAAIPGTFATGASAAPAPTSVGLAGPTGVSGASTIAPTSAGVAITGTTASGSSSVPGPSSSGSAGPAAASLWGTVGATGATQRADQTAPTTGTMSTAFVARVPSATVAVNDRLVFNGRRWHVNTGGTLGAGSGPTGTGQQADGSAQLIALASTDTALTMTTQTANSVLVACAMRDKWASDTSAPTSSKGGTFVLQGSAHFYTGFPSAASAVFAMTNAAGGSGHTFGLSWPAGVSAGAEASLLVVEIPTGKATSFVQAVSFVEVTSSSIETSASVTTTGPAMLVAFWLGAGNVLTPIGSEHPANPVTPFTRLLNADTSVSIHANGYVQAKASVAFLAAPGTYTAQWSSVTEPAQLYLVAIQEQAGTTASGASVVPAPTSAGAAITSAAASGASTVPGPSSSGLAGVGVSGSTTAPAPASAGSAVTATTASGSSVVASPSSAGAAIPGTFATGASAAPAPTSVGLAGPSGAAAGGSSAVPGPASSGAALPGTFATGSSVVPAPTSSGSAASLFGGAAGSSAVPSPSSGGAAIPGTFATGASAAPAPTSVGLVFSTPSNIAPWREPFADLIAQVDRIALRTLGGQPVIYRSATGVVVQVSGIFDDNYVLARGTEPMGVEAVSPAVFLVISDLPADPEQDDPVITVRGVDYRIVEHKPADFGSILLILRRL